MVPICGKLTRLRLNTFDELHVNIALPLHMNATPNSLLAYRRGKRRRR